MAKNGWLIGVGVVLVVLYAMNNGMLNFGGNDNGNAGQGGTPQTNIIGYQPTAAYVAKDVFSTTQATGTSYYKRNGEPTSTTAITNTNVGEAITYWLDNSSWFVEPTTKTAINGVTAITAKSYQNSSSLSLKLFDVDNNQFLTDSAAGATNVTIGANGVGNLDLRYQNIAKYANMPFGGCVAIEVPNTITDVSLGGSGISSSTPCPYKWTYSVSSTGNTYRTYAVPAGFDANGDGLLKQISMQVKAGASNPAGASYVTFQSADYYITNAGEIALGIEKDANDDTTKTGHTKILTFGIS